MKKNSLQTLHIEIERGPQSTRKRNTCWPLAYVETSKYFPSTSLLANENQNSPIKKMSLSVDTAHHKLPKLETNTLNTEHSSNEDDNESTGHTDEAASVKDESISNSSDAQDNDSDEDEKPAKKPKFDEDAAEATWVKTDQEKQLMYELFGDKKQLLSKLANDGIAANITGAKNEDSVTADSRKPVWNDSDDEDLHCDDVIDYAIKGAPVVQKLGKYKVHLEKTFSNVLGTPAWADLNRKAEPDSDEEILQSVGHLAAPSTTSIRLRPNQLQFKRMKDLNRATYAEGPGITGIEFHPTSSVAVVTGASGIATIYSIDGKQNDKLHSMSFNNYPIKMCRINRISGTEALMGGSKKFCYSYDMMTGSTQRIFLPTGITKMAQFEVSPCGKFICIIGRFGEVHLLSYSSKELVCTLKQEHPATAVAFSIDSKEIFSHGNDAQVTVFDVRQQRAKHRFYDEGCVNGSGLAISPSSGRLLATGSEQGVVNVYEMDSLMTSAWPKPTKTVFNLTTGITSLQFNHSSELLAIGSKHIDDAVKLVHFPSGSVYQNFPGMQGNIGCPSVVSFSPQSGYFAIGNLKKEVTLYRLKHFNNY